MKILKIFIFWFFDLFERFYINTYDPDLHIARRSGHRSRSTHFILPLKVEPVLIDFPLVHIPNFNVLKTIFKVLKTIFEVLKTNLKVLKTIFKVLKTIFKVLKTNFNMLKTNAENDFQGAMRPPPPPYKAEDSCRELRSRVVAGRRGAVEAAEEPAALWSAHELAVGVGAVLHTCQAHKAQRANAAL